MAKDYIFDNEFGVTFKDKMVEYLEDLDVRDIAQTTRVNNILTENPQPSEVVDARGGFTVLDNRLDNFDTQLAEIANVVVSIDKFPIVVPEVNDTARIARAVDFVVSKGGGTVLLKDGEFIASSYKVKNGVFLEGQGVGTILKLANTTNADFITLDNDLVRHAGIRNLIVDGNKANNTTGRGIYFNAPTYAIDAGQYYADNFLTVDTVYIRNCAGDGLVTGSNIREGQFNKIFAFRNNGTGITLGGSDCFLSNSTSYWNTGSGIKITGPNHKLSQLKTFGNQVYGFWLNACKRIVGVNLEAQENYNHGVLIGDCEDISILNVLADANGYNPSSIPVQPSNLNGVHVYNSKNLKIEVIATDFHRAALEDGYQCYGVRIEGSSNYDVRVKSQFQYQDYYTSNNLKGILSVNDKVIQNDIILVNNRNGDFDNVIEFHRDNKKRLVTGEIYNVSGNYYTIDSYDVNENYVASAFRMKNTGDAYIGQNGKTLGFFSNYGTVKQTVTGATDTDKLNSLLTILRGYGLVN